MPADAQRCFSLLTHEHLALQILIKFVMATPLISHFRPVSKLLPAESMTFLVEMFMKGNAAVICGDGMSVLQI